MHMLMFALSPASTWIDAGGSGCHFTTTKYRALCLEAPTGIDVGIGVGDFSVVSAEELDLLLRSGQLLAAGAGVLQGSHFGRVAEKERNDLWRQGKDRKHEDRWQQGKWRKLHRENNVRGTHKVKVPHAPLQDVMLTGSLEWQPWLSTYTAVVDTLHGWSFRMPEVVRRNILRWNNILYDYIYIYHITMPSVDSKSIRTLGLAFLRRIIEMLTFYNFVFVLGSKRNLTISLSDPPCFIWININKMSENT